MGVRGQKCLISGNHMVRTWRRELGLAREKQSTTTSDLREKKGKKKTVLTSWIYNITKEIIDKTGQIWQKRDDLLCHEQGTSAEGRHAVCEGVTGTEKRERKKGVSTESLNILSVYIKTCDMCMEEPCSTAARHCGSMHSAIKKAGMVWVCLYLCVSLGLWAGDLCGPSLSLLRKSP